MVKRRALLVAAAALGAGKTLVACGGGGGGSPPPAGSTEPPPWSLAVTLFAGAVGYVFDLNQTLPTGIRAGGTFRVDPSGSPLPLGVTLSSNGQLAATSAAVAVIANGVVFSYTEP
jgi:hypothetical protein